MTTSPTPDQGETCDRVHVSSSSPGPVSRTWTIRVAFSAQWLTSNKTSSYRYGRKGWRESVMVACRQAKLPKGLTVPVTIHAVCYYATRQPPVRDTQNLAPTLKAIVDGLVPQTVVKRQGVPHTRGGYGLLVDDSDRHIRPPITWTVVRSPSGMPYVDLTITEVPNA